MDRPLQFHFSRALLVGLGLSLGMSSCDSKDSESPTLEVLALETSEALTALESDGLSFLDRVVAAPKSVAFEGVRRLTFAPSTTPPIDDPEGEPDSEFSTPGHRTVYLEEVWADGTGHFTVTPLDLIEPHLPFDETEQFLVLQQQRERFLYLHRDFQIRNLALFRENWSLVVIDDSAEFLGRPALVTRIERLGDALRDRSYEVTFDVETGLVLAYTELDGRNRPIALVEYESLSVNAVHEHGAFGGVLESASRSAADEEGETFTFESTLDSNASSVEGSSDSAPLEEDGEVDLDSSPLLEERSDADLVEAIASLDERRLQIPSTAPKGFRLMKKVVITDPFQSRWMRLIYSDGVEELFVAIEFDRHPSSPIGIQSPILEVDGRDGDPPAAREDWVEVFTSGNWSVAQGEFRVSSILAVGKMHHRDLLVMLQSTLQ